MKAFTFDLQRFDYVEPDGVAVYVEGFDDDGVEISTSDDGQDLISITTPKTRGGVITVSNDYNFTVDGHEVKVANVDLCEPNSIIFTYGENGSISLDLSNLTVADGENLYVVSAADADKLIPPAYFNAIKIKANTYEYFSGGGAYFRLSSDGAVEGFVFVNEGDSISVGKNAIAIYDEDYAKNAILNVVSGANYNVTKTGNNYLLEITESTKFTIGDTELSFEISKATKANLASTPIVVNFDEYGSIVSVDGLYNLTRASDKLIVNGADVTSADGGLPFYDDNHNLNYISVSDGDFTLKGGTSGNQTIAISPGATVYGVNPKPVSDDGIGIINDDDNVAITGGNGDDSIKNSAFFVEINAGSGNDSISNEGENVTINGGAGNDTIKINSTKTLVQYNAGDGKDLIQGFNETSTLQIDGGSGEYTSLKSGNNILVTVGDDEITLRGAAKLATVNIEGKEVTNVNPLLITLTEDDDSIDNTLDGATIQALGGNDWILNDGSNGSTNGGAGNDSILNSGSNVTINGGAGNDVIRLSNSAVGNLIQYAGDGNDTIWGFNATSTLQIGGGSGTYSIKTSSDDVIVSVGKGEITLVGAASWTSVHINDSEIRLPITLTEGNDSIDNTLDGATINALGGNDTIKNYGDNVLINTGAGDDTVFNNGNNVTIDAGDGNDYITNYVSQVTIDAGDGNDYIYSSGTNVSINAGTGNDTILNHDSNVTINAGAGDDWILNDGSNGSINGGAGNDEIHNKWGSNNVSINAGSGNDSISNEGENVTINSGAGNDTIKIDSTKTLVQYNAGDGKDLIQGFNETSTLQIGGGSGEYTSLKSGNDILVTVGDDEITLNGAAKLATVNIEGKEVTNVNPLLITLTDGNDIIDNTLDGATIQALGGNDIIYNGNESYDGGSKVSIDGGAGDDFIDNYNGNNLSINGGTGNDYISNYGDNVTINAGAGDDSIENLCSEQVTINSGAGNDSILNNGANVIIDGGAGNDSIYTSGDNVTIDGGADNDIIENYGTFGTINGGTGNDYIYNNCFREDDDSIYYFSDNNGNNVLFKYVEGDGKDLIQGFNETSTLQIGDGTSTYSTQVSGSDIVVTVGDGEISLKGAASLSTVNIEGEEVQPVNPLFIVGTEGNDIIGNTLAGATINALGGNDYISNSGYNVSIDAGDGNDDISNSGYDVSIDAGDGDNTISNDDANVSINTGAGNDIIYNEGGNDVKGFCFEANVTINTGAGDDYIRNLYGGNSIINAGAGNDWIENEGEKCEEEFYFGADNVTINAGDGDDFISNVGSSGVSIVAGTGDDIIYNKGDYYVYYDEDRAYFYEASNNVTINAGAGDDSIINDGQQVTFIYTDGDGNDLIQGFNETSTLQIGGGTGTYSTTKSGDDIIVTVGKGNITLQGAANLEYFNINDEKIFNKSWTLDGTTATYGSLIVKGVKSLDGISLDGTTVTISKASLGTKKVTISDGYTLKLGSNVTAPKETSTAWSLSGTTATYKQNTSAGYTLANNAITYSKAATKTLATVKGVKSTSGLSVNDKIITVKKASLGTNKVTVSSGYTLKLGSNVTKSTTSKAWSLKNTTASYKQTMTAGYTLADNAITYSKAATETLATVKGIKSLDGISLKKKVVTISDASLNKNKVTVSDGYTLKLGSNVTKSTTSEAWSLKSTTATYKQTTTAGYTLANNAITYSKAATKTLATVKGVKSTSGLSVNDKIITVKKASLGTNKVTVSSGYTLKLGSNVTAPKETSTTWSLSGTTATYKQTTTAGYTLANNAITYSKAATKTLATVKGVKSTSGLSVNDKIITVKKASLGTNKVTVSSGYTLKLGSNVTAPKETSTTWSLSGTTATYKQTTTAGYTLANNAITYSKAATETLATIKGAKSKEGIAVSGDTITPAATSLSKKVTISGSYAYDFASDYTKATITGSGNADTITANGNNLLINGDDGNDRIISNGLKVTINGDSGNDSLWGGKGNDTLDGGAGNDIIRGEKGNDSIFGGTGNDELYGGSGNDSLWGGAGNDTLYGGAGDDVFIYKPKEGVDTICDYASGDMLQILKANGTNGKYSKAEFASGNLTLTIDGGGTVIFNNVKSGDTFNINGTTRTISGKTLK